MHATPLSTGDRLPSLELFHASGEPAPFATLAGPNSAVLYFMRTSTCPVCHSHLRTITRSPVLAQRVVVVVPGAPADAAQVLRRHPLLTGRVVSSETAHASVGLFVRGGLQQSGTFVVDAAGSVTSARLSTLPVGAFSESEALAALGG